jgi:AraC family transcriptional regulator of adaptative response / DNA-3-methyladenine glycosylase II
MELSDAACYRIFKARDPRFDGRLFVGVSTTGIYCRPICRVPLPRSSRCRFFSNPGAAHANGFRPCLRCRPEVAPDVAAWHGTATTVARALRLMEADGVASPALDDLARRLGVGRRHLRRLFDRHVGASPAEIVQSRRIQLAVRLVRETRLPMWDVAQSAGFGSVRRFNETFRATFGRPPSVIRRSRPGPGAAADGGIALRLPHVAPYAWDEVIAFLAARAIEGVEIVSTTGYTRSIDLPAGGHGIISVSRQEPRELLVRVHGAGPGTLPHVLHRVRQVFDLSADSAAIDRDLSTDPWLAPLVEARPGLRIVGAWSTFEVAVRAVLGQQIRLASACQLTGRLVAQAGVPLDLRLRAIQPGLTHLFPTAMQVAALSRLALPVPATRSTALHSLARAVVADAGLLEPGGDLEQSVSRLQALQGVGSWTAHYVAMRALREPDAFPATDVGLLKAIEMVAGRRLSPGQFLERAKRWRPWRAYAAAHLWAALAAGQR